MFTDVVQNPRQLSLSVVRKHVRNSVNYVFVQPDFHIARLDELIKELMNSLL